MTNLLCSSIKNSSYRQKVICSQAVDKVPLAITVKWAKASFGIQGCS